MIRELPRWFTSAGYQPVTGGTLLQHRALSDRGLIVTSNGKALRWLKDRPETVQPSGLYPCVPLLKLLIRLHISSHHPPAHMNFIELLLIVASMLVSAHPIQDVVAPHDPITTQAITVACSATNARTCTCDDGGPTPCSPDITAHTVLNERDLPPGVCTGEDGGPTPCSLLFKAKRPRDAMPTHVKCARIIYRLVSLMSAQTQVRNCGAHATGFC